MGYFLIFLGIDLIVWFVIFRFFLGPKPLNRKRPPGKDSDDSDDGLQVTDVPKLDLPPGVTWPVKEDDLVEA